MYASQNQKIIAILTREDTGGTTAWHMEIVGQGKGGPNAYPPIKVANGSSADFHYIITGAGTQNITFEPNNPIAAAPYSGTVNSYPVTVMSTDQIKDVKVSGGGRVLTFTDINKNPPVDLTYQLNFTGAPSLDPIIQNGGGGGNIIDSSALWVAAVAVGLLLATAAFFIGRSYQRKRR